MKSLPHYKKFQQTAAIPHISKASLKYRNHTLKYNKIPQGSKSFFKKLQEPFGAFKI